MVPEGIEYLKLSDGSQRWLWSCWYSSRLWRTGVVHRLDDAKAAASCAWADLVDSLAPTAAAELPNASGAEVVDIDQVVAGVAEHIASDVQGATLQPAACAGQETGHVWDARISRHGTKYWQCWNCYAQRRDDPGRG